MVIGWRLEDNDSVLRIVVDDVDQCSVEICHCDMDGYYVEEMFTPRQEELYGRDTLSAIVSDAMEQLNEAKVLSSKNMLFEVEEVDGTKKEIRESSWQEVLYHVSCDCRCIRLVSTEEVVHG